MKGIEYIIAIVACIFLITGAIGLGHKQAMRSVEKACNTDREFQSSGKRYMCMKGF